MYDGYHFSYDVEGVYNPFSLLNALSKKNFGMYWFATGTPTFLIEKLKRFGFDPKKITDEDLYAQESILTDYRFDNPNPIPLFYKTGYLTIRGYDKKYRSYQLGYPTDEKIVEQNFQNVIYIVFMLLGQYTFTEIHSAKGRAD